MDAVIVDGRSLRVRDVVAVAREGARCTLSEEARARIIRSRAVVDDLIRDSRPSHGITHREKVGRVRVKVDALEEEGGVAYGITTGFGELARVPIDPQDAEELQLNLLLSHACGLGDALPREVVRGMLLLRANALATGFSGIRIEVVELILELLNQGITPVVPSQGSLGASGDLAPLAHAALVLVGLGEAEIDGESGHVSGADALARRDLAPVTLQAKEGLALINGTQLMSSALAFAVHDGWRLVRSAEGIAALSVEVLMGSDKPFDARIHDARPHPGQRATAANMRAFLAGSGIVHSHEGCDRVQDAYSLRCIPQVLGAVRTALTHTQSVAEIEFNSATDNPLIFEDGDTISGGNFHGEPLALVAAYLTVALAEVASISERRVARMTDPRLSEGLPPFLSAHSGLHSGYMIAQYVAAGLVMENRVLCHPAAADSVPTSANQEDHVSNGAVQCMNLLKVLGNVQKAVGIEALLAAQALEFRRPLQAGPGAEAVHAAVRARVPKLDRDRYARPDLEAAIDAVSSGEIEHALANAVNLLE